MNSRAANRLLEHYVAAKTPQNFNKKSFLQQTINFCQCLVEARMQSQLEQIFSLINRFKAGRSGYFFRQCDDAMAEQQLKSLNKVINSACDELQTKHNSLWRQLLLTNQIDVAGSSFDLQSDSDKSNLLKNELQSAFTIVLKNMSWAKVLLPDALQALFNAFESKLSNASLGFLRQHNQATISKYAAILPKKFTFQDSMSHLNKDNLADKKIDKRISSSISSSQNNSNTSTLDYPVIINPSLSVDDNLDFEIIEEQNLEALHLDYSLLDAMLVKKYAYRPAVMDKSGQISWLAKLAQPGLESARQTLNSIPMAVSVQFSSHHLASNEKVNPRQSSVIESSVIKVSAVHDISDNYSIIALSNLSTVMAKPSNLQQSGILDSSFVIVKSLIDRPLEQSGLVSQTSIANNYNSVIDENKIKLISQQNKLNGLYLDALALFANREWFKAEQLKSAEPCSLVLNHSFDYELESWLIAADSWLNPLSVESAADSITAIDILLADFSASKSPGGKFADLFEYLKKTVVGDNLVAKCKAIQREKTKFEANIQQFCSQLSEDDIKNNPGLQELFKNAWTFNKYVTDFNIENIENGEAKNKLLLRCRLLLDLLSSLDRRLQLFQLQLKPLQSLQPINGWPNKFIYASLAERRQEMASELNRIISSKNYSAEPVGINSALNIRKPNFLANLPTYELPNLENYYVDLSLVIDHDLENYPSYIFFDSTSSVASIVQQYEKIKSYCTFKITLPGNCNLSDYLQKADNKKTFCTRLNQLVKKDTQARRKIYLATNKFWLEDRCLAGLESYLLQHKDSKDSFQTLQENYFKTVENEFVHAAQLIRQCKNLSDRLKL